MVLEELTDSLQLSLCTEVTLVDGIEDIPCHLAILYACTLHHIVIPYGIHTCSPLFLNGSSHSLLGLLVAELHSQTQ